MQQGSPQSTPQVHILPLSLTVYQHTLLGALLQVHNTTRTNQQRGLDLAAAALDNDHQTPDQDRELRYYLAGERTEAAAQERVVSACSRSFHVHSSPWCAIASGEGLTGRQVPADR